MSRRISASGRSPTDRSTPPMTEDPQPEIDEPEIPRWPAARRLTFIILAAVVCWVAALGAGWIVWHLLTS
jgi:hypothetical protein